MNSWGCYQAVLAFMVAVGLSAKVVTRALAVPEPLAGAIVLAAILTTFYVLMPRFFQTAKFVPRRWVPLVIGGCGLFVLLDWALF